MRRPPVPLGPTLLLPALRCSYHTVPPHFQNANAKRTPLPNRTARPTHCVGRLTDRHDALRCFLARECAPQQHTTSQSRHNLTPHLTPHQPRTPPAPNPFSLHHTADLLPCRPEPQTRGIAAVQSQHQMHVTCTHSRPQTLCCKLRHVCSCCQCSQTLQLCRQVHLHTTHPCRLPVCINDTFTL